MSFEDEFPSLEDKNDMIIFVGNPAEPYEEEVYFKNTIKKYCLDKQKVREAIEKKIHKVIDTEFEHIVTRDYLLELLKELGL